eukprot:c18729_g1_i1 orf=284-1165(-)
MARPEKNISLHTHEEENNILSPGEGRSIARIAGTDSETSSAAWFTLAWSDIWKIFGREEKIITTIEDDLHTIAETVKKDAGTVGEIAEKVKQFSRAIEQDADKVEALVVKEEKATEFIHHDFTTTIDKPQDTVCMVQQMKTKGGDQDVSSLLDFGWTRTLFTVLLVILNVMVVQHHISEGKKQMEEAGEGERKGVKGFTQSSFRTYLNGALFHLGSIFNLLSFLRRFLTRRIRAVAEAEEDVVDAAEYVKGISKAVEAAADNTKSFSKAVERDAELFETFIDKIHAGKNNGQE